MSDDTSIRQLGRAARRDLAAGLTVAVVAIPQSMAYALVADVPPQYGLYTLILHTLLGTFLNANSLMAVGPVNTQSLLTASVLTHLLSDPSLSQADRGNLYLQLVLGLSLVKGVMQLLLAAVRLGGVARYFSQSVVVGFTAGAGVLIAIGQVAPLLGLAGPAHHDFLPGAWGQLAVLLGSLDNLNPLAVALGLATIAVVGGAQRYSRLVPGPLLAVLGTGVAVWLMGSSESIPCVDIQQAILPRPAWPELSFRQYEDLLAGGFALALLGLVETYSITKAIATRDEPSRLVNRELASQGLLHIVGGFCGCIPGSGSLSRSALNVYAGAATRFSGMVCGLIVLLVFSSAGSLARYVPLATLAGLLMVIAWGLIDIKMIRNMLRTDRLDGAVCLFTLLATLTVPLHYAIFSGVLLNLAMFIHRSSQLNLIQMVPTDSGAFLERPPQSINDEQIVMLQLQGDLYFAVADRLQQELREYTLSRVQVVVFRLKRMHSIDTSVLKVLDQFVHHMHARGASVLLCGVQPELLAKMTVWGLIDQVGVENVFETEAGIFSSARQALAHADTLLESRSQE